MMAPSDNIITITFSLLLFLSPHVVEAKGFIRVGYWYYQSTLPASNINTSLFTHLICAFAEVNNSTFQLSVPSSSFSSFSNDTKSKNTSLKTLLSIGGGHAPKAVFSMIISQPSQRKAFIHSSLKIARLYGFDGLDFFWPWRWSSTSSDVTNMAVLFSEWRSAVDSEERSSSQSKLILTFGAPNMTTVLSSTLPVHSIKRNVDWVHVLTYDYCAPTHEKLTCEHTPLYNPISQASTSSDINEWINAGLSAKKLVLGLSFYGYAWKLVDPEKHYIGAPAQGPAYSDFGSVLSYRQIRGNIDMYNATRSYNSTYVSNYCFYGTTWIGYDDTEAVTTKVSYIKEKGLLGYHVWEVTLDYNWALSEAAAQTIGLGVNGITKSKSQRHKKLTVMLPVVASVVLLISFGFGYYLKRRKGPPGKNRDEEAKFMTSDGLRVFSWGDITASTNSFSVQNKLGEGGYGPVYKGKLKDGQEIAVKRLSDSSQQGLEEFQNEVTLTARLQHVNLVRVLGFCTERGEKMLIYEYMPNGSLDFYLFDPVRSLLLDWPKRVQIIEGVIQGLLYFQEYSRLTIIHRDLKASNVLLDYAMNPKISDFGMARTFQKNIHEANTGKIVGTYGYVPPEYIRNGVYSVKSDVYSFGVLLLQMISGKAVSALYGDGEHQTLLDHAYEMWEKGAGKEFLDPELDDTHSSCKMIRCLHVALLCVQEKPKDRPTMLEVSSMIKSEIRDLPIPDTPAFSMRTGSRWNSPSKDNYTANDATISEMIPR